MNIILVNFHCYYPGRRETDAESRESERERERRLITGAQFSVVTEPTESADMCDGAPAE